MIKALGNIQHDGKGYEANDLISALPEQEKALVDIGIAEYVEIENLEQIGSLSPVKFNKQKKIKK